MPKTIDISPSAASLSESLRGVGYDLVTAVADIVDNSLAARAKKIEISFIRTDDASVWMKIEDDGCGMSQDKLIQAMRLGSLSPKDYRAETDLGRFGMGLKTASFSQCRKLVVRTKQAGLCTCMEWDLDYLQEKDQWLAINHADSIPDERLTFSTQRENGTIVFWPKLDNRFTSISQDDFEQEVRKLYRHLALTFHRFIDEEHISFTLNGKNINAIDPFYEKSLGHPFHYPNTCWPRFSHKPQVELRAFIIPPEHMQSDFFFTKEEKYQMQGFYIYRGKRLIRAGGWLGLRDCSRNKESQLARIRLDFLNNSDSRWSLDIRKSTAHPPRDILPWLANYAFSARAKSEEVYKQLSTLNTEAKTNVQQTLWHKQRGEADSVDSSNPICQVILNAADENRLQPGVLEGFLQLLAVSHPAFVKKSLSSDISEAQKATFIFIFKELCSLEGEENTLKLLKSTQPFSRWNTLLSDMKIKKQE